ncbi:MAG: putative ABC transporter permease subunit [Candidatus Zhuqueibacterota bacterium]
MTRGLKHLILLLNVKFAILLNGFRRGPAKKRFRKFAALIGGCVIFFLIYKWIFEIFTVLGEDSGLGMTLMNNSLAVIFFGFFIFLFASGITISIHYLFISSDLPLLMTMPISNQTIFSFKLIEAIFANSTFFFFLGMPTFIAFGLMNHAGWLYYPLMLINAFCFLATPITLSFLGALLVIRLIPPARAKEFMSILLGAVSLGIWLALQLVRASQFDRSSSDFNPKSIERLEHISRTAWLNLLPSTWAAKSLAGFAHGNFALIRDNFLPLLALTALMVYASIALSRAAFKNGLISNNQSVTIKKKSRAKQEPATRHSFAETLFSGPAASMLLRDTKLFTRDSRQLVNLLMFTAMMIVFPLIQRPENMDPAFSVYFPYMFIFLFNAIIAAQISSRLIPIEAGSFWITRLLPQSPFRLLSGKLLVAFLFNTLLAWIAVITIGIYFHHPFRITVLALVISLAISGALSAHGLFFGVSFANFSWDHPKRMIKQSGSFLMSISSMVLIGIIGGFAVGLFYIGKSLEMATASLELLAAGVALIASAIIAIIMTMLAVHRFSHMEWEL